MIGDGVGISGRGLITGQPCSLKVRRPLGLREDTFGRRGEAGIIFEQEGMHIPAHPDYYFEQANCTALMVDGAPPVFVIEHLLAALWAAGIDRARIVMNGLEAPNQDGSARPLYDEIIAAGREELGERPGLSLSKTVRVEDGDGAYIEIAPDSELSVEYNFAHPELGEQRFSAVIERSWAVDELLPARSFITEREAEAAIASGVLKNTSEEDALLIRGGQPNKPLRFPDEYARHKVLDLIGDLYILPFELTGRITAHRSGHRLNRALARKLIAFT